MIPYREYVPKQLPKGTTKLGMYLVELVNEVKDKDHLKYRIFFDLAFNLYDHPEDLDMFQKYGLTPTESMFDTEVILGEMTDPLNDFFDPEVNLRYFKLMDDYKQTEKLLNQFFLESVTVARDFMTTVQAMFSVDTDLISAHLYNSIAEPIVKKLKEQCDLALKDLTESKVQSDPHYEDLKAIIEQFLEVGLHQLQDEVGFTDRKVFSDSHEFIDQFEGHRMVFSDLESRVKKGLDVKDVIDEELKNMDDPSKDAFIEFVTEEFEHINSSDELAMVMEVIASYKHALESGKKEFFWSYTAPIDKLARYEIRGKKIVQV